MNRLIIPAVITACLLIAPPASAADPHRADQMSGDPAPVAADNRSVLVWTQVERSYILMQMRHFLGGTQVITDALSRGDMKTVAQTARPMGAGHAMPGSLKGKLPPAFKQMASSLHSTFDQMALDAETLGEVSHTLTLLSGALQRCVACHEVYRIVTAE